MNYFSPEPKKRKEDFFDMEREWSALDRALKKGKMVIVTGLRRYGKTSLIMTYMNESRKKYVYLNCRLLPPVVSLNSFKALIEGELAKNSWGIRLLQNLKSAEVQLAGFGLKVDAKSEESVLRTLKALEGSVLVMDEAQALRMSSYRFDSLLAYIFDATDIKLIISGSEVGLLYRFLRLEDPEAPLYGRAYSEVRLNPLSKEKAKEFLLRGFEQEKITVNEKVIEDALEKLDGVIGWLAYFGYSLATGGLSVEKIYERASKLAVDELKKALKLYASAERRYSEALRIVATLSSASWSEIKRGIEAKLGKITDSTLANILRNLTDAGFVKKDGNEYKVADPVLHHGILAHL
jgi:AAA+ ATPase superfamily predicted ATPase